jgi:hypothetical protein
MGSQLSVPQPALLHPSSLLAQLSLGVRASKLLQTWAKEPEAAQRPRVREPLCKSAGQGEWWETPQLLLQAKGAGVRAWDSSPPSSFLDTPQRALSAPSDPRPVLWLLSTVSGLCPVPSNAWTLNHSARPRPPG